MRKLSLNILSVFVFVSVSGRLSADSPHGKEFKLSCDLCHSSKGWKLDRSIYAFDHNKTAFPLVGQHDVIDCKQCHPTLIFSEAKKTCVDCHTDMHNQTVGPDCGRCHTPKSWIIENINEIHQRSRFPLVGPHYTADCDQCHPSASLLLFEPRGVECFDCHEADYLATTSPNHVEGGYSKNCTECHLLTSFTWTGGGINHSFFPLVEGHAIGNCSLCHTGGNYSNISKECNSCHMPNYNATTNPNHKTANIPTTCNDCHTLAPGWKPAEFTIHDAQFFPVYSGKHQGTWNSCAECHTNPASYNTFSCIDCHEHNQPDMNDKHSDVGGYSYNSIACYECHPTGSSEGSFNHNTSIFPLTGAHLTTPCSECHVSGFSGTPTECSACHSTVYNQSTNPDHIKLAIPNTCSNCHTTNPGWKPASFTIHSNYYPLTGGHATVADNCVLCHNGNYNNTPNACVGCHQNNYNQTTNPNHAAIGIPTTCADCHTTNPGWSPATFAIHNNYFPLTGGHVGIGCNSCHPGGNYSNTPNTCVACHQNNYNQTTNPNHAAAGIPTTCADCHTTNPGWSPATFVIHNTYYPLTGAHTSVSCNSCHNGNYNNTPNTCVGCHQTNYNQTTNPNHAAIGIPTTCATCHTTNPDWHPATFPIHSNYYVLQGAHVSVDCYSCHHGNYNSTPNTCYGCHQTDYNQTNNPPHASAQFPTNCELCHTQNAWIPSTFQHDQQYFPIYSGKHEGEWSLCADCHTNPNNYQVFSCIDCHEHNKADMDSEHNGVSGYQYNSIACYTCHPTGNAGGKMLKPKNPIQKD